MNNLSKNELIFYKKLLKKKYRQKERLFIIEGEHLIEEALKQKNLIKLIITSNKQLKISNKEISIKYTSYDNICSLSTTKTPQESIAICNFLTKNKIEGKKILVLNKINDPGNLGTLIRTAYAFNIKTIIVDGVEIYNPKTLRASQGSIFNINIFNTNDLIKEINKLKSEQYLIVGSILKNAIDYRKLNLNNKKVAIVLGNEANGIEENIIKLLDYKVYIPISFESLNVSIAGAILISKYYDK